MLSSILRQQQRNASRLSRVFLGECVASSSRRCSSSTFNQADDDTHDDFKPKVKQTSSDDNVQDMIARDVAEHSVFIYMKGHPTAPMCGFSNMACRILDAYDVEYGSRDVLSDPVLREGIKAYTSWPTIPQIFIQGDFVGGSDILLDMHKSGELVEVLEKISDTKNA